MTRALAALAFLVFSVSADDKPKVESPAEKLAAIKKQHEEAEAAARKELQKLPETPEGIKKAEELFKAFGKEQNDRLAAAVEIAKADPKSDLALTALEWVLTIPSSYHLPAGVSAMKLATEHQASNPKIGKTIAWLGYYPPHPDLDKERAEVGRCSIREVAEKNPDKNARGQAVMALAWGAGRKFAIAEYKRTPDTDKLAAEAEKAFEAVVKDYADCPRMMREGQPRLARRPSRSCSNYAICELAKPPPTLRPKALTVAKFKLTDHRGKVTVVNFWASWCGPCMAMVPHEREMVERFKDKPFVLIGVNGDDTREKAKEVMAKEKMTWPSFWNGPKDDDKAISRAWNVRGWPTIYVLDPKGVIRFKNVVAKELDKAVEELLKEMEEKK